ncbi:MAG TPA: hypothetical protein VGS19_10825 [Streptosporangiaceae bacterium]|nr:hypothetical protein [Streptosporangiaceae bacterium]
MIVFPVTLVALVVIFSSIVAASLPLLFLVTGSVVLLFQALVLSCLSLTATFGALV